MTHAIVDAATVEPLHGVLKPLRDPLGVSAFGINELELPAGAEGPEHDHAKDGQEEVYVVIRGSGTIRVDGAEMGLHPGQYVYLSPTTRRQMIAGDDGLAWVGVGCQPGAFAPQQ
jgi:quercetin dioxygenase-like cupin family protein